MRKRIFWITSIVSTLLTTAATLFGFIFTSRLMYLKKKEDQFILDRELNAKRFDEAWFQTVKKEEKWIDTNNGYQIKAVFLEPLETKNYVIICHGVTENKINSMKYARLFERLGFNSVVYDHRRHGDSGGKTTSFGHYEKMDLQNVVEAVKEHAGSEAVIGIHGESMGAATTILYAGTLEDGADFYIADCPFSDFTDQLLYLMRKETPLRSSLALKLADVFLRVRDGYSMRLVSPREAVVNIENPMLFIHSLPDDFILPEMTIELYKAKPSNKKLKLFDIGPHAQSYNMNPEEYQQTIHEFLEEFHL
ncbi:alpha/beta hydrolase [Paenisporosarcina cavernae]|uniref:Alpha/beta hydrolase n=1 Tax=Paenisporosarcina cavernae TaxID=2320858 RepID=A0A385YS52_9BACL|nr:alpha/beta hydrolase [Paenisporosarcina cavernae]AYC29334.1 alpha/beta hydrolase [Paenisporosarcina cavernae]